MAHLSADLLQYVLLIFIYLAKKLNLVRSKVIVNEPTIVEALTILRGIRERYEQHHQKVWITNQAIDTAVKLAHRYLTARRYVPCIFTTLY